MSSSQNRKKQKAPLRKSVAQRSSNRPRTQNEQQDSFMKSSAKQAVGREHQSAIIAMMDPSAGGGGETHIPSHMPWLRTSTIESISLNISTGAQTLPASGEFGFQAYARPQKTLTLSSTAGDVGDLNAINGTFNETAWSSASFLDAKVSLEHNLLRSTPVTGTSAGVSFPCNPITASGAGNRNVSIVGPTRSGGFRVLTYSGPVDALVLEATSSVASFSAGQSAAIAVAFTAITTHVRFTYATPSSLPAFAGSWGFTSAPLGITLALGVAARDYNLTTLDSVDQLRAHRIVGQSALLTYMGSNFKNGGQVAIARVYASWQPTPGLTLFESINKLPRSRRYVGRLANGAHSFWMPSAITDFEPKVDGSSSLTEYKPEMKIVCAGKFDDVTESALLQIDTIVEFSSDNPAYASIDYAPAWNSFDVALELAARMNPNGENPDHLKKIGKFLQAKIGQGLNYAISHPTEIAAVIAKLAPLLL